MYTPNPNPIKLNTSEQEAFDFIIDRLNNLIFGRWKTSRGKVGTGVFLRTRYKADRFKSKKDVELRVKGSGARWQEGRELFGGVSGEATETTVSVIISGYTKKSDFAKYYEQLPYRFWLSMTSFKVVLRHEITHTKDEIQLGTSDIYNKYGFLRYINDPDRVEFRAHLSEWDQYTTELKNIVDTLEDSEYSRRVWEKIKPRIAQFMEYENGQATRINFEQMLNVQIVDPRNSFIVPFMLQDLKANLDVLDESKRSFTGAIRYYEKVMEHQIWRKSYDEKLREYNALMNKYWSLKRKIFLRLYNEEDAKLNIDPGYERVDPDRDTLSKAAEKEAYAEMRKKYKNFTTRKPKRKTKFTKGEKEAIHRKIRRNYTDMLSAIYTLFKQKGLLNPALYAHHPLQRRRREKLTKLQEKRSQTLLKREKIVINSLWDRFSSLGEK